MALPAPLWPYDQSTYSGIIPSVPSQVSTNWGHPVIGNFVPQRKRMPAVRIQTHLHGNLIASTDDFRIGTKALIEKKDPTFTGR